MVMNAGSTSTDKEYGQSFNIFKDINSAVEFLILNKDVSKRNIDKNKLNDAVKFLHTLAFKKGLPSKIINKICTTIVFNDFYDIVTRRKLLYSCVPDNEGFPESVLPLAISCTDVQNINSGWQLSILHWIAGLLEYDLIDKNSSLLHICYTSLFNHIQNIALTGLCIKILCHITTRSDVTRLRVQILMRLENKIGYQEYVPALIRIYQIFRPDLVIFRWDKLKAFPTTPKPLRDFLVNALERDADCTRSGASREDLWPSIAFSRKRNPFHEPSAIPLPEILVYSENIEETKKTKLSVLQYNRIGDLTENLDHREDWLWPNNPVSLLSRPILIPFFKPHDTKVLLAVSNFLEIALREEVIDGNGSPERQRRLLDVCVSLLRRSEAMFPAVYHFLTEFLTKWDKASHFSKVLEIISFAPFVSPSSFFEIIFTHFHQIVATVDVDRICEIVEAFSNTAVTWALQAHEEQKFYENNEEYHNIVEDFSPLEGIYFLEKSMKKIFAVALIRHRLKCQLHNVFISFYNKVNMVCTELNLPLFIAPPTELVLSIIIDSDPVSVHRLGHLFVNIHTYLKRVKKFKNDRGSQNICRLSLDNVKNVNLSVTIFLDSVIMCKGFCKRWWEHLSYFIGRNAATKLKSLPEISLYGNVCRALPYSPLSLFYIKELGDYFSNEEERKKVIQRIIGELSERGFDGIEKCSNAYIKKV